MTDPCCDYRDHGSGVCACPEHRLSEQHPFGWTDSGPSLEQLESDE